MGVVLNLTVESGGWKKDSTGKFSLNTGTGAIKIVGNWQKRILQEMDLFMCRFYGRVLSII